MLDPRRLRCFVAVAEELHFRRAAERLHLAQPPLTRHIAALEAELGMRLFERGTRAVRLTAEGSELLPHARRLLQEMQSTEAVARRIATGRAGVLSIGYASSVPFSELFISSLREHGSRHPEVTLDLRQVPSAAQAGLVRDGSLDLGFHRPCGPDDPASIEILHLWTERLVAAVPTTSRFAALGSIPLASLQPEPFVLFPSLYGSGLNERVFLLCGEAGFVPRPGPSARQLTSIVALVGAGLGVSVVPASTRSVRHSSVSYVPLESANATLDLRLFIRGRDRPAALLPFVDTLLELRQHTHSDP